LTAYTSYGQENDSNSGFPIDVKIFEDGEDDNTNAEINQDKVEALIEEFKNIMEIPENERTTEQWNRAIEIIFLIYYGADLSLLFKELNIELENQQKLSKEMDRLYKEITILTEEEADLLKQFKELQENFSMLYESYNTMEKGFHLLPYATVGVTTGMGINAGFGLFIPVTYNIVIGGAFIWHNPIESIQYFSFDFMFGWKF
jgi:hypothetical protein